MEKLCVHFKRIDLEMKEMEVEAERLKRYDFNSSLEIDLRPVENEPRPSVQRFARAMEKVLRDNDYKDGWEEMTNEEIVDGLIEEATEIHVAFYHRDVDKDLTEEDIVGLVHEAIDTANFAHMLYDNNRDIYNKERDE